MPRGRKGLPQESIDSILLAMCRRNDIEQETLAGYFDRLDEEWTRGAREKVLNLLRSSDMMAQRAALVILSELATDFDIEELEDFVTDPTVSDVAKLSLSPLLKELGSELAEDGLVEYLNDPVGAMQRMQMRLLELVGQSERGTEAVLVDVTSMPVERRISFIQWLGNSNDPRAANLLIPLLENQPSKVVTVIIDALEQLGAIAAPRSVPALRHLIATTSNRQLKQQARVVLGRLTMLTAPGLLDEMPEALTPADLPPFQARVSFLDGAGSQFILLLWKRPDGLLKGVNIFYRDQIGIKDCYGIDEMEMQQLSRITGDMHEQGIHSVEVPFSFARLLIMEARAVNKRTRRALPISYSIWRPFIEFEPISRKEKASLPPAILETLPLDEETRAQAQKGGDLYQLPEFYSWYFETIQQLEPYINRYWNACSALEAPNASAKLLNEGRSQEQVKQELLEELVTEALEKLFDEKWRVLYAERLLRQAAVFQLVGREDVAHTIRAVATVMKPASGVVISEQAFPRMMMQLSIEQGPLRMMVEAFGDSSLGDQDLRALAHDLVGEDDN
uniref:HEAT repeat domain-containing protein n=1 Tax=Thermosporothrix sp. COM3 TaxID=2490863 RepID=A0A455SRD9_9CHLR|nr:hypothetical protein KTC_35260 [Thermosporothrix sp. COM3]